MKDAKGLFVHVALPAVARRGFRQHHNRLGCSTNTVIYTTWVFIITKPDRIKYIKNEKYLTI